MMKSLAALVLMATVWSPAADVAGEYRLSMPEIGSGLLLRTDQTFEYFFIYGAADYSAKGTWRVEQGNVILNSSGKEEPPFRLMKAAAGKSSEIRVHIQAPNGRGVQHMDVSVLTSSGTTQERTDLEGVAVLPRDSTAKSISIHVPVYDIEAGPFELAGDQSEYWFEINGDAITQLRFRDERLKIDGGALEMTYWKGDKPLRYRKR